MLTLISLCSLWIAWCAQHSLLISSHAHRTARTLLGRYFGLYRLGYVLFSVVTLVPLLYYQYSLPQHVIFAWHGPWRLLQAGLLIYAAVLFYLGSRVYDMAYFLGISQWRQYRRAEAPAPLPFRCDGILGYVRHPWYGGGIAFLWGAGPNSDVSLLGKVILSAYLVIGTFLEEKRLKKELGTPYITYCRSVPMLIPWKRKSLGA
ncbi:MAG: hypothetical protein GWP11_07655 [Proteobacteria bacterium]|nr:hypothetical protein [Pseudomonadota bacterium]